MEKCKITPLGKLYEFRAFLERKIRLYYDNIANLKEKKLSMFYDGIGVPNYAKDHEEEFKEIDKDIDDWTRLKNEAEAALVFVKAQIAFEED